MDRMLVRHPIEEQLLTGTVGHFKKYHGCLGTVVDIGAHVGELAIAAAKAGAQRVWAIEPDRENYTVLVLNILNNEFAGRIIPLQMAVWVDNGPVVLKKCAGNTGQRSLVYQPSVATASEIVPGITLETLMAWTGPIDYMKLDIEGVEHLVLQAVPDYVMRQVKTLDLDLHDTTHPEYFEGLDIDQERTRECLKRVGFKVPDRNGALNEWMMLERSE